MHLEIRSTLLEYQGSSIQHLRSNFRGFQEPFTDTAYLKLECLGAPTYTLAKALKLFYAEGFPQLPGSLSYTYVIPLLL
jgi:hypothetical protein